LALESREGRRPPYSMMAFIGRSRIEFSVEAA